MCGPQERTPAENFIAYSGQLSPDSDLHANLSLASYVLGTSFTVVQALACNRSSLFLLPNSTSALMAFGSSLVPSLLASLRIPPPASPSTLPSPSIEMYQRLAVPKSNSKSPQQRARYCKYKDAHISGTIGLTLTESQIQEIQKEGGKTQLQLMTALCGSTADSQFVATTASKKTCNKVTGSTQQSPDTSISSSTAFSLVADLKVDTSACRTWWIILVSVLVIVAVFAIVATLTPLKHIIRPYPGRVRSL